MKTILLTLLLIFSVNTSNAQVWLNLESGIGGVFEELDESGSDKVDSRSGLLGLGSAGLEFFYSPQRSLELRYQYEYVDRSQWFKSGSHSRETALISQIKVHSKIGEKDSFSGHFGALVGLGKRNIEWTRLAESEPIGLETGEDKIRYVALGFSVGLKSVWQGQVLGFAIEPRFDFPLSSIRQVLTGLEPLGPAAKFNTSPEVRITFRFTVGFSLL